MTAAAERIRREVLALPAEEQEELLEALNAEVLPAHAADDEDEAFGDEWDEVIAARAMEVELGKVELIPAEQVEAKIDAMLTQRRSVQR